MNKYLVYYAYYHNDGDERSPTISNTDVKVACIYADSHNEADENCYEAMNLDNTGYIVHVVQL